MKPLPLYPCTPQWEADYRKVIGSDEWLARKVDRNRRLGEHWAFLKDWVPELFTEWSKERRFLDIGPGPGESIEIARSFGMDAYGVDAKRGAGGMGEKYLKVSQMMSQRQKLNIAYSGFWKWSADIDREWRTSIGIVVSRGAIEQVFSEHMDGPPHDEHHNAKMLHWKVNGETLDAMDHFMSSLRQAMCLYGSLVIVGNGSANTSEYEEMMFRAADANGFKLVRRDSMCSHKWVRTP